MRTPSRMFADLPISEGQESPQRPSILRSKTAVALSLVGFIGSLLAAGYPLDAYDRTQIRRLKGYALIQSGEVKGRKLPAGALMGDSEIRLRLADVNSDFDIGEETAHDADLQAGVERIVGQRDPSYRLAILDITNPENPRFASLNPDKGYIPGSLGKMLVMAGLFDRVRHLFPEDEAAREAFLRASVFEADDFVVGDSHTVPVPLADFSAVPHRRIRVGDRFTLWEWLDHMVSPSSNAAASTVWKQILLIDRMGRSFPGAATEENVTGVFLGTPRGLLSDRAIELLAKPLRDAGLDTQDLRQRTLFTAGGRKALSGQSSYATPRQLLRFLVRIEEGRLVDRWSSLEMKKLLYFTRNRYRYAASPALKNAAVFFKSGSLYRCRPEEGYSCGRYKGNALNLMHSVAIIESDFTSDGRQRIYMLALMSDVRKVNSAAEHLAIATEIESLIEELNP